MTSRSFLPIMRNFSSKNCRETQNTHFVFSNFFFFENRAVYEKMWKNIVERSRPQYGAWALHAGYLKGKVIPLQA